MSSGGKRAGAGRPYGTGRYGEPTRAIRIPASKIEEILYFIQKGGCRLPLYQCAVAAGFPSPGDDEIDQMLDLNELLVKRPAATFFVRVSGDSMIKAGIHHNDIIVVDRSIKPEDGKIVIAAVNGELTVKRLYQKKGVIKLLPENDAYRPIELPEESDLHIWGVVTSVIHHVG